MVSHITDEVRTTSFLMDSPDEISTELHQSFSDLVSGFEHRTGIKATFWFDCVMSHHRSFATCCSAPRKKR